MKTVKYFSSAVLIILMTCLVACGNAGVSINPLQQKVVIDSIVEARSFLLQDSIDQVCIRRLNKFAQAKADSIVKANKSK